MRAFLASRFLALAAALSLIAFTACACLLLLDVRALVKAQNGVAQREGAKYRELADAHARQIEQDFRLGREAILVRFDLLLGKADVQLAGMRGDVRGIADQANARIGDALSRYDRTLTLAEGLHASVKPALDGLAQTEAQFGAMAESYAALPDRLGAELRPSWMALQPEITCRALDGSGYGGCWHSRITGLFGEAERVGGVFTQQFPLFAKSLNGIASDAHGWTDKYVMPHPMTRGQKVKAVGTIFLGLGSSALRGGVF